jgi:hypothetical protein
MWTTRRCRLSGILGWCSLVGHRPHQVPFICLGKSSLGQCRKPPCRESGGVVLRLSGNRRSSGCTPGLIILAWATRAVVSRPVSPAAIANARHPRRDRSTHTAKSSRGHKTDHHRRRDAGWREAAHGCCLRTEATWSRNANIWYLNLHPIRRLRRGQSRDSYR